MSEAVADYEAEFGEITEAEIAEVKHRDALASVIRRGQLGQRRGRKAR